MQAGVWVSLNLVLTRHIIGLVQHTPDTLSGLHMTGDATTLLKTNIIPLRIIANSNVLTLLFPNVFNEGPVNSTAAITSNEMRGTCNSLTVT